VAEMSPLGKFIMLVLRNGSKGAAALLVLFAGILIYQKRTPEGHFAMSRQDWSFLGVLLVLLCLAIYLVREISKEIEKH
jgi:hypothetical protein